MLVGEVAKLAGLSKDGVRHYEELGLIVSTPREAGTRTYRDYNPTVLKTIELIRAAQRLGYSLQETGPLLKVFAKGATTEQTIEFLEERLLVIRGKIAELREVEGYICCKMERYKALSAEATGGLVKVDGKND